MTGDTPHYWSYCDHCDREVVICGHCGNNTCNGGSGEEIGPNPGETIPCRACGSAHELYQTGTPPKMTK